MNTSSTTIAALTLIGGVLLFIINQWVQKFFIDPLHEQRKAIGEVDFALTFWAWAYSNPQDRTTLEPEQIAERERGAQPIRECASRLIATTNAVRAYWLVLKGPSRHQAGEAARRLIGISNSMFTGTGSDNSQDANATRTLLRLQVSAKKS